MQSSASATGCITFILGPLFIQPAYRNLRALTYLSLGLLANVFILHGIYLHGFALHRRRLSLEWMGLMALLNFTGCAAYAFRVSCCVRVKHYPSTDLLMAKYRFRSPSSLASLTLWVRRIRLCMLRWWLPVWCIIMVFRRHYWKHEESCNRSARERSFAKISFAIRTAIGT